MDEANLYKKVWLSLSIHILISIFAPSYMVVVAQSVRASDCGSEGRGFEPHLPPKNKKKRKGERKLSPFY